MSSCSFAGKASSNRGLFPLCIHVPALIPYSMDTQIEYIIMYSMNITHNRDGILSPSDGHSLFVFVECFDEEKRTRWKRTDSEMWKIPGPARTTQAPFACFHFTSFHFTTSGQVVTVRAAVPPLLSPSPPLPERCRAERPILELIFRPPNWGQIVIIWYCTDEMSILTLILPSGSVYGAQFLITKLLQVNKFE
jgi:hypothetical protein